MHPELFHGALVRLAALDPEKDAEAVARWTLDSEYLRLLDTSPAQPWPLKKARDEVAGAPSNESWLFAVRRLSDDHLLGFVNLETGRWTHAEAWLGIGLGEREAWGQGYGTDAVRIILRYAFGELNQYRVSLSVFAYNLRAIRSYEKAGFVAEGRERQRIHRAGRYWDIIYMGILRNEWEAQRNG